MAIVTHLRHSESREEAVRRLAEKARECGVRLVRDASDGRHYASSVSQPGHWHYVTAYSCDCKGFVSHQRCMHHSALLAAYGWIAPGFSPEPQPIRIRPAYCPECNGTGEVPGTVTTGSHTWRYDTVTCSSCHGTGQLRPDRQAA